MSDIREFTMKEFIENGLEVPPSANVISMEKFHERISQIFELCAEYLGKSYGPYGSATIISEHPYTSVTKDGYSIMKRLSFSMMRGSLDAAICSLIQKPCNKLNHIVGDGTTTAIIAVNAIFQQFIEYQEAINAFKLPPREILKAYDRVMHDILKGVESETRDIKNLEPDRLLKAMRSIAYISSNGDEEITDIIGTLYEKLNYPLIDITKSVDGITRCTYNTGYIHNTHLIDSINVTNDNMEAALTNVNVLLYDFKITKDSYDYIIAPLNEMSRHQGRKLLVIAPSYDQLMLRDVAIQANGEMRATRSVNLVLATTTTVTNLGRGTFEDLAMLLNTTIITRTIEMNMIDFIIGDSGEEYASIDRVINIHHRPWDTQDDTMDKELPVLHYNPITKQIEKRVIDTYEDAPMLGYVKNATIPLDSGISIFDGFVYDEVLYNKTIELVTHRLEESKKKSLEINLINIQAQELTTRLHRLGMKMGTIEVGGSSTESVQLLYDSVEDTVKACASAYHNGIVSGCSIATIRAAGNVLSETDPYSLDFIICQIILKGFEHVYRTILSSRYTDFDLMINMEADGMYSDKSLHDLYDRLVEEYRITIPYNIVATTANALQNAEVNFVNAEYNAEVARYNDISIALNAGGCSIEDIDPEYLDEDGELKDIPLPVYKNMVGNMNAFDFIITISKVSGIAFDLTTGDLSGDIINSARTDIEVLKASSDLISLLITGNQLIVSDYINYARD